MATKNLIDTVAKCKDLTVRKGKNLTGSRLYPGGLSDTAGIWTAVFHGLPTSIRSVLLFTQTTQTTATKHWTKPADGKISSVISMRV